MGVGQVPDDAQAGDAELRKVVREEARVEEVNARGVPHVGGLAVLEADVATRLELHDEPRDVLLGDGAQPLLDRLELVADVANLLRLGADAVGCCAVLLGVAWRPLGALKVLELLSCSS